MKPDKITPVEKWLSNFQFPSEPIAEVIPVCPLDVVLSTVSCEPTYT
jgi:hypothetical protein